MALTYTVFKDAAEPAGVGGDLTTASRSFNAGELVVICFSVSDNTNAGTLSIANSGTAQTWVPIGAPTNAASNCKIAAWQCVMSATQAMTVTVSGSGSGAAETSVIFTLQHAGQHATTPIPAGNVFSGTGGTDISQLITPTASGSCLWMIAGDWNAQNSYAAIANCALDQNEHQATKQTATLVRPTTQPRSDASAFTIGETDSGSIAWMAFEVQAASTGPAITTQPQGAAAAVGATTTFNVAATTSGGTLTYQWQQSSDGGETWASVSGGSGGTSATYTTPAASSANSGTKYRCVVSDDNGATTSLDAWFFTSGLAITGKGRRGYGSAWWRRAGRRLGRIGGPGTGLLREMPERVPSIDNANFIAAWNDWFFPSIRTPKLLQAWNGSAWVSKPAKVWDGGAWVTKPAKFYNGSAWVSA